MIRGRLGHYGFTLLEMVLAMGIMAVLVAGLGSAVMIATRAMGSTDAAVHQKTQTASTLEQVLADLKLTQSFSELTANEAIFIVPDRDTPADGTSELIHLAWSGTPGDPLTMRYNNGAAFNLADNVHQFNLTNMTRTIAPQAIAAPSVDPNSWGYFISEETGGDRVLFVSGGGQIWLPLLGQLAIIPTTQEVLRINQLENWGYDVTLILQGESQSNFDAAVNETDVIYIPAGISDNALGTKVTSAPAGIVNEANSMHYNLGLQNGSSSTEYGDKIEVVDALHYITEPFGLDDVDICDSNQTLNKSTGNLGAARILATIDGTPTMECLSAGDPLKGVGGTAAARRIFLPWGGDDFNFNTLEPDGIIIMRRAVEWAAGAGTAPQGAFGYDTEFATRVDNVSNIQIATQAELPVSGTIQSIHVYLKGKNNKNFRCAIYSDSGGEPDALLVSSSHGNTSNDTQWYQVAVPPTALAAGTYWLAVGLDHGSQGYYQQSGGETRYRNHNAESEGFLSSWGSSNDSFGIQFSIHATYTPD